MRRWSNRFRRMKDERGTVAVEFGLIGPLMCLMLLGTVEFCRAWMASRQFEATITGIARHLARYPEYDSNVRAFAPPIAAALMPFGTTNGLNVTVYSLTKTASGIQLAFPAHALFGVDPGIPWANVVNANDYRLNEPTIVVAGSYRYTPLFTFGTGVSLTFTKSYPIMPAFNRSYPWNSGKSSDKYVY